MNLPARRTPAAPASDAAPPAGGVPLGRPDAAGPGPGDDAVTAVAEPPEAPTPEGEPVGAARTPRAGRNLPAAVAVGVGLGGLVLLSLLLLRWLFVAVESIALLIGMWELRGALATRRINLPVVPVAVGIVGTLIATYIGGLEAMAVAAGFGVLLVLVGRMGGGERGFVRDGSAGVFVFGYLGILGAFAPLALAEHDGPQRVTMFILLAVCNDTGGYLLGILVGRHPLAPRISPKKSWEGLGGSLLFAVVGGIIAQTLMLHGQWWQGMVLGAAVVASATVGDLIESMIKRDLEIKDMGSLLPGHGGLMDRLDSLLPTAAVSWALLAAFLGR